VGAKYSFCMTVAERKQDNRNGEQYLQSGTLTCLKLVFETNCLLLNNDLVNTNHMLR